MKPFLHYLRYWLQVAKLSFMTEMVYRTSFYMRVVRIFMENFVSLFTLNIIFSHTPDLLGWHREEVFLVYAVWLATVCIYYFFISNSLVKTSDDIRRGKIDAWIIKPVDSQFILTFRNVHISNLLRIIAALIIANYALSHLNITFSWSTIILFSAQFIAGLVALYSFMFLAVTSAFLTHSNHQYFMAETLVELGRYPLDIFGPGKTFLLSTVIPLALISTIPTRTLLGQITYLSWLIFPVCILLLIISRKLWIFALRHYSSASS